MASTASKPLAVPGTQASTASPSTTADEVELHGVQNGDAKPGPPLEEDIMQCARLGAVQHIQAMLDSGTYNAKYKDEEGITPLHWAAINNQYATCKYLIDQGADVNAKGGDSNATPAMWAAQRCHYYIVNLLLQSGSDPMLVDGQGYNILHLATIDGNVLLLILLLHQNIPVDVVDPQGHTSLMWAGYKGWPACVDLLLRWGASVNATDDNGYTPLHWALVKGSKPCLEKLIEYGADRFAKTTEGKTPATCAAEMNSAHVWHKALAEQGYNPDGTPKALPLNLAAILKDRSKMSKFFFLFPYLIIFAALFVLSRFSIYIGLPLFFAVAFGLQNLVQIIANQGPPDYHSLHKTPYLAGVFSGTLFWVGVLYCTSILPATFRTHPIYNFLFALFFLGTAYFYTIAMMADPGYIPKLASRNQQRAVIEELFSLWRFDEESFCVQCMIRKPLRSKHCRRCGRCVAKHDHHCPWINNCVANNNIRHFFIYIICLEVGIIFYVRLALFYLDSLPAQDPSKCNIVSGPVCDFVLRDPWTIALSFWTTLQLIWVTMLLVVQTVQISKNQTTFENMKRHAFHEDQHGHHGHSHAPHHSTTAAPLGPGTSSLNDTAAASSRLDPHPHKKPDGCLTQWKKLLGLDAFLATAQEATDETQRRRRNPFSHGVVGNCTDFWCDPAPIFGKRPSGEGYLGGEVVNYAKMYEPPLSMGVRRGGYTSVSGGEGEEV